MKQKSEYAGPRVGEGGILSAGQEIRIEFRSLLTGPVPTVDFLNVHRMLCPETPYYKWASRRLKDTMAEEGLDFLTDKIVCQDSGRERSAHFVSLDVAKEAAMLERNTRGKQVRRYFIEAEKALHMRAARHPDAENLQKRILLLETQRDAALDMLSIISPKHGFGTLTREELLRKGIRRASCPVSGGRYEDALEYTGCAAVVERLNRQLELNFSYSTKGGPRS